MTLIGIRTHGSGHVVGPIHARIRAGRVGTEVSPARHARTPREALATLSALLRQASAYPDAKPATHDSDRTQEADMLIAESELKPQAEAVLRLLIERGSLTTLEALHAGAGIRLPARVKEIREAFGEHVITTDYETTDGTRYARYKWRGHGSQQEMFG